MSAAFSVWWTPIHRDRLRGVLPAAISGDPSRRIPCLETWQNGIARMRIIALLFAFMLAGCAGDRLIAETKPITKCETVSALLSNPSATRGQVATAMEMGRNNRCFGT